MSSAQREIKRIDDGSLETEAPEPFVLKQQIAEKIAAHRARRGRPAGPQLAPPQSPPARERSARIAATVAERYAHSQSYRAFLAEEAEKAIRQAEAAAEIAKRNADAVAQAQYELLAELDQYATEAPSAPPAPVSPQPSQNLADLLIVPPAPAPPVAEATLGPAAALKVRLYEEAALKSPQQPPAAPSAAHLSDEVDEAETIALDEEIAFRQAPVFDDTTPPVEIPANLIEFPRQLVASRRARPRLAEGPLREDADRSPESSQLRIFEVEAAQISSTPVVESAAPEWSSILLSPQPAPTMVQLMDDELFVPTVRVPQTAPISLRLMAAIVDGVIVTASMLIFVAVFVLTASHFARPGALRMSPQAALIAAAGTLAIFGLIYQLLFFTFSESTLGMRYARIGLCTFSDDNPTRAALRHRIFAHLLSACPLGIGYLWALLDDDRLGWHDRITRMYQRSY